MQEAATKQGWVVACLAACDAQAPSHVFVAGPAGGVGQKVPEDLELLATCEEAGAASPRLVGGPVGGIQEDRVGPV